jgi:outer membrane biogenesis lipoprotein LolB
MKSGINLMAAFALAAFLLSACSFLPPRKPTPEADALLARLIDANQDLMDFKGIGNLKLTHEGQVQSARLAFAGSIPAKLRLDVMGSPGQHLASLASDGKWFYMLFYQEDRFYKQRVSDSALERLVALPVTVLDILDILAGRVPIRTHRTADLMDNRKGNGYILELKSQWGRTRQRIFVDDRREAVVGYEIVNDNGSLAYRVDIIESQIVDGHRVPKLLAIADDKDERLDLKVERFWANVAIAPSGFVLQAPH